MVFYLCILEKHFGDKHLNCCWASGYRPWETLDELNSSVLKNITREPLSSRAAVGRSSNHLDFSAWWRWAGSGAQHRHRCACSQVGWDVHQGSKWDRSLSPRGLSQSWLWAMEQHGKPCASAAQTAAEWASGNPVPLGAWNTGRHDKWLGRYRHVLTVCCSVQMAAVS